MKSTTIALVLLLFVAAATVAAAAQTPQWKNADYDAVRDFSSQSNPNGVWSYGWESTFAGPLTLYTGVGSCETPGISWWYLACQTQPVLGHNDTDKVVCYYDFCLPPTYLLLHPGPAGEFSVLRWTAPSSGVFLVEGTFVGIATAPTTTDVHVLVNSKNSLLSGPITSYGWPLSFKLKGKVVAGDTVDFLVGFGKEGNNGSDSTGVRFSLTRMGQH